MTKASIKAKSVRWQLERTEDEEGGVLPLSSSVLSDASLLSLSRALGPGGLSTCMCLAGLPTAVVVGALLGSGAAPDPAGPQRDDSSAAAVTNRLLRHWKALKRTETKEREMVRSLEKALRCSGQTAIADVLIERHLESRPLTDRCWKGKNPLD